MIITESLQIFCKIAKNIFTSFCTDIRINNNQQNKFNFQSGLTKQILKAEQKTKPSSVTRYFKESPYRSQAYSNMDFKNNKAYALACRMCAEIFKNFRKIHDYRYNFVLQDCIFPTDFYVYNTEELTDNKDKDIIFCTQPCYTNDFFKDKREIYANTLLLSDKFNSLEEIDNCMEKFKSINYFSTGHFLHMFVHEFIHSIQNIIIEGYSHAHNCSLEHTLDHLDRDISKKENEIVADVLGEYASTQGYPSGQYNEIFAEAWTKFICDSLDEDCVHFKKDPIAEMQKTPKDFQKILKNVSTINFYSYDGNRIVSRLFAHPTD